MALFTGEYRPSIDEKGRLSLPVKLRKRRIVTLPASRKKAGSIYNEWVFTYGYDRCIMGMPQETWVGFVNEKISSLSKAVKENRKRIRFLLSGAFECELDKQGRFILPGNLKEYANISQDVVIIGVGEFIEIWEISSYEREMQMGKTSLNGFASQFWD